MGENLSGDLNNYTLYFAVIPAPSPHTCVFHALVFRPVAGPAQLTLLSPPLLLPTAKP